jgi:hypothetical protein
VPVCAALLLSAPRNAVNTSCASEQLLPGVANTVPSQLRVPVLGNGPAVCWAGSTGAVDVATVRAVDGLDLGGVVRAAVEGDDALPYTLSKHSWIALPAPWEVEWFTSRAMFP